jgi:hypothetical protein
MAWFGNASYIPDPVIKSNSIIAREADNSSVEIKDAT